MLTPHGRREWGIATALAIPLAILAVTMSWWWALAPVVLGWIAVAGFFRDPPRSLPTTIVPGDMISPADGRVSKVFTIDHHDAVDGPAVVVRIFLSVLDVHINRAPCDGTVVSVVHAPGRYLDARTEESAKVNESMLTVLRMDDGRHVGVRQISGAIARRIVCPLRPGDQVRRGERFGMIKFGSTTELILPDPDEIEVRVAEGDRVRGGVTILATMRDDDA